MAALKASLTLQGDKEALVPNLAAELAATIDECNARGAVYSEAGKVDSSAVYYSNGIEWRCW